MANETLSRLLLIAVAATVQPLAASSRPICSEAECKSPTSRFRSDRWQCCQEAGRGVQRGNASVLRLVALDNTSYCPDEPP
ncbi:hypothetical protein C7974DRAFT_73452 [Boeremia exigua]|uniref:uncharacterized protein n=1 Tax=Boeremia exigua TaxID=749465 RepID=UPI001E8DEA83|nr:uncharacterized protein C7974DRAFT_73452 [Boeremia exigua]KAH6614248.1 hypothetical protein C7974DRAFT_73452 [Boeremia exigua]